MVSLRPQEDPHRPAPKQIYNIRVYALAAAASFASMMIGYDSAFLGTVLVLPSFIKDFGTLAPNTSANLVTTYQIGALFGAVIGYPLAFYYGRRWGLVTCAALFAIGSVVMVIASPSTGLGPIYGGRAVAGIAIGAASNLTPLYISEIAPTAIRGQLVGLYEAGWQVGGLLGFWINYAVQTTLPESTTQWRIPFAVQLIPGGLFLLCSPFLIESPRWLLSKDRHEHAVKNLCTIRHLPSDHPYLIDELTMMQGGIEAERAQAGRGIIGPFKQLLQAGVRFRLFISVMLFFFQNGTAINAINYYSPTIIKSFGITGLNSSLISTGIFGVIKTAAAFVWLLLLIDQFGRRRIFITGSIGCGLMLWWMAIYLAAAPKNSFATGELTPGSRSMLAAFYIWTVFYGSTWNGTPWVFGSEAFPMGSRSAGQCCAAFANWAWNLLVARTTPLAFAAIGSNFYFVFAAVTTASIPFVYFLLPETKQIPLEHMDELFSSPEPARRAGPVLRQQLSERARPSDAIGATAAARNRTGSAGSSSESDIEK
ncbi:general substrate transporter [Tilletiaria anomala UBC 951]|uniref:Quinate transporter n=1 Tax=Tilletiaria anomala (strain ATCC 24038 / CBS 436.72 / UBC 951) TaxID=1037660 RepID=A0A066W1K5_TILAU|nr:general substrate transporter [Tilletiaria anomala UBC 951]KDN44944.1 general substrate transporter [Tilletiaria anomala UBC 951]